MKKKDPIQADQLKISVHWKEREASEESNVIEREPECYFSIVTLETRREWRNGSKIMRKNYFNLGFYI